MSRLRCSVVTAVLAVGVLGVPPALAAGEAQPAAGGQRLIAPDGGRLDGLGYSVDADRGTVVVGAPQDDLGAAVDAGSVYVFVEGGQGQPQAKLVAADAAGGDRFGFSSAVSGDLAVVGSDRADTAAGADAGAAYVFRRVGSVWTQEAKLTAPDGAAGAGFGMSVDVDGDTVAVHAPRADTTRGVDAGSSYVFVAAGGSWTLQAQLSVSDPPVEFFNNSRQLSLDGDTLAYGAPYEDVAGAADAGAVHVFVRQGSQWLDEAVLTASTPEAFATLGSAVALDRGTVVAGTPHSTLDGQQDAGTVDVFVGAGAAWTEQAVIAPPGRQSYDVCGLSVDVLADTLILGCGYDDTPGGKDAGTALVYVRAGTSWALGNSLRAGDPLSGALFGRSVTLDEGGAVVGANLAPGRNARTTGAAYAFAARP